MTRGLLYYSFLICETWTHGRYLTLLRHDVLIPTTTFQGPWLTAVVGEVRSQIWGYM
jgi:hypothetical protein